MRRMIAGCAVLACAVGGCARSTFIARTDASAASAPDAVTPALDAASTETSAISQLDSSQAESRESDGSWTDALPSDGTDRDTVPLDVLRTDALASTPDTCTDAGVLAPPADLASAITGRWLHCSGYAFPQPSGHITGIEFASDHHWYLLQYTADGSGALERLTTPDASGSWALVPGAPRQVNLYYSGGELPTLVAVSEAPPRLLQLGIPPVGFELFVAVP